MDANLADFLTSRHNTTVSYKDMSFLNQIGLLHGALNTGFLVQYWGLIIDLLFMGLERASDFIGDPKNPNMFMSFVSD